MPGCLEVKKLLPVIGAAGKQTLQSGRPRSLVRTSRTRRILEKLSAEKACIDFLAPISGIGNQGDGPMSLNHRFSQIRSFSQRLEIKLRFFFLADWGASPWVSPLRHAPRIEELFDHKLLPPHRHHHHHNHKQLCQHIKHLLPRHHPPNAYVCPKAKIDPLQSLGNIPLIHTNVHRKQGERPRRHEPTPSTGIGSYEDISLIVNSPALILSKNSGIQLESAKNRLTLIKNRLKSAKLA